MRRAPVLVSLLASACLGALTGCGSDGSATAAPAAAVEADAHAGHGASASSSDASAEQGHDHGAGNVAGDGHDHAHLDIAESGVGRVLEEAGDGYGNLMREAPSDARPTVALRAKADPAGGWTVQVVTTGFRWSPQDVNTPADAGSGHAHLYVKGTKVARIYGEWQFVPGSAAKAGQALDVVLYADDHTAWAVDGTPVEASVVLPAPAAQAAA